MPEPIRSLNTIRIASPCEADWDSMTGNDQVRFCDHCNLHVRNISVMTRQEAMRLVSRSRGRLCLRFVQAPDGSPMTRQVPEKLHRIGRRISRIAAGAFSATLGLSAAAAQTRTPANPPPLSRIATAVKTVSPEDFGAGLCGTVFDPNGALVAGATLTLTNPVVNISYTATTGDDGTYKFTALKPGTYTMVAEAASFAKTDTSEIVLRPDFETPMDVTMQLPQLLAQVEVTLTTIEDTVTMGVVGFAEPENPLVRAAYKNDLNAVADLALTSSDVNVQDKLTHTTALAHAVGNANRDMVQVLLSAGANINARNRYGVTPLMHLGSDATVEFLRDLLAVGADIHARDESGMTALLKVAGSSKFEVVDELIKAGAHLDVKDNEGTTALMNAVENEDPRVLKFLIGAGLDAAAKNHDGETALMIATRWAATEAVKALIEKGNTNAANNAGRTALMYAASQENPEITRMLIDKGADVNRKDENGRTALMEAADEGGTETVETLIAAGADPNLQDKEGQTALMRADDVETAIILLNARADSSLRDNKGLTALALARKEEEEEVVNLLVSRGAPEK